MSDYPLKHTLVPGSTMDLHREGRERSSLIDLRGTTPVVPGTSVLDLGGPYYAHTWLQQVWVARDELFLDAFLSGAEGPHAFWTDVKDGVATISLLPKGSPELALLGHPGTGLYHVFPAFKRMIWE